MLSGRDNSLTGVNLDRPNLVATSGTYNANWGPGLQYINPANFSQNAAGTFGNLGRDAVRGPAQVNVDASLSRLFAFRERVRLEARGEAFNVINHTNFGNPTVTLTSANFGRILTANDPRIFQFAMKLIF